MSHTASEESRPRRILLGGVALGVSLMLLAGCASPGNDAEPTESIADESALPTAQSTDEPDATATESLPEAVETTATTDATPTETADDRRVVPVSIIGAEYVADEGGIEVRSVVSEYIGTGTCTFTAVDGQGNEAKIEVESKPDAQSTVCPSSLIPGVSSGSWSVTVKFANDEVRGESQPVAVEVEG